MYEKIDVLKRSKKALLGFFTCNLFILMSLSEFYSNKEFKVIAIFSILYLTMYVTVKKLETMQAIKFYRLMNILISVLYLLIFVYYLFKLSSPMYSIVVVIVYIGIIKIAKNKLNNFELYTNSDGVAYIKCSVTKLNIRTYVIVTSLGIWLGNLVVNVNIDLYGTIFFYILFVQGCYYYYFELQYFLENNVEYVIQKVNKI